MRRATAMVVVLAITSAALGALLLSSQGGKGPALTSAAPLAPRAPAVSRTPKPKPTPFLTITKSVTPTPFATLTPTPTGSRTVTPSHTRTRTPTPTVTRTRTPTLTATRTVTVTPAHTSVPTQAPTPAREEVPLDAGCNLRSFLPYYARGTALHTVAADIDGAERLWFQVAATYEFDLYDDSSPERSTAAFLDREAGFVCVDGPTTWHRPLA